MAPTATASRTRPRTTIAGAANAATPTSMSGITLRPALSGWCRWVRAINFWASRLPGEFAAGRVATERHRLGAHRLAGKRHAEPQCLGPPRRHQRQPASRCRTRAISLSRQPEPNSLAQSHTPLPLPANGTWGNAGRNILRVPGIWQADTSLEKRFPVSERIAISFRADVFNVFNRAQIGKPNATWTNPAQGTTFGADHEPLYHVGDRHRHSAPDAIHAATFFLRVNLIAAPGSISRAGFQAPGNTKTFPARQIQFGLKLTF